MAPSDYYIKWQDPYLSNMYGSFFSQVHSLLLHNSSSSFIFTLLSEPVICKSCRVLYRVKLLSFFTALFRHVSTHAIVFHAHYSRAFHALATVIGIPLICYYSTLSLDTENPFTSSLRFDIKTLIVDYSLGFGCTRNLQAGISNQLRFCVTYIVFVLYRHRMVEC